MEAREYKELEEKLCNELKEIMRKSSFNMGDIETIDKLTHSLKSISCLKEDGMSHRSYRTSYRDDSYGNWNAEGSYDDGYSNRTMRSYGMDDAIHMMQEKINDERIPSNDRNAILRAMEILKR